MSNPDSAENLYKRQIFFYNTSINMETTEQTRILMIPWRDFVLGGSYMMLRIL